MGQRLVITIEKNEKAIAKIYYHWSAYTYSALLETKKVIDCIYNHENESTKEMLLRLIRFCEENGGGIRGDDMEFAYIRNRFPGEDFKTDGYSRNNGLIAISENGMKDLQYWSEGDVIINLDEDMINFGIFSNYDNFAEYIEERKEWDDDFEGLELEEIPDIGCDLGYISVEDLDAVIASVDEANSDLVRNGNEIFEFVA